MQHQVLSPLLRLGLHRLSVAEGPAATSTSGPLPGDRPTTCEPVPPPVRGDLVRGSGVEMLITEQDKFPGMTRGLARPKPHVSPLVGLLASAQIWPIVIYSGLVVHQLAGEFPNRTPLMILPVGVSAPLVGSIHTAVW